MVDRPPLSRREREMMDVVYRLGRATASEVMAGLTAPPSYSAVRATLRILEEKGHLTHQSDGNRYVYLPTVPSAKARRSALQSLVRTFFGGSPKDAVVALLDEADQLSPEDMAEIRRRIDAAKKNRR
jgi:predicted transcriptional regulator